MHHDELDRRVGRGMGMAGVRHPVEVHEDVGLADRRAHRRKVDELRAKPSPGSTVAPLIFQSSGMPSPVLQASAKPQWAVNSSPEPSQAFDLESRRRRLVVAVGADERVVEEDVDRAGPTGAELQAEVD